MAWIRFCMNHVCAWMKSLVQPQHIEQRGIYCFLSYKTFEIESIVHKSNVLVQLPYQKVYSISHLLRSETARPTAGICALRESCYMYGHRWCQPLPGMGARSCWTAAPHRSLSGNEYLSWYPCAQTQAQLCESDPQENTAHGVIVLSESTQPNAAHLAPNLNDGLGTGDRFQNQDFMKFRCQHCHSPFLIPRATQNRRSLPSKYL